MTDQLEFLGYVVGRLEAAGVPYMLTGSVAMSLYGQPRMTRDIDLVVECTSTGAEDWVRMFGSECYVSAEAVADAIARGGMFNVIHNEDLIVLMEHAADMDLRYLESWAARLGVGPQLKELLG